MVNSRKVRAIICLSFSSPVSWLVQLSALKWYWKWKLSYVLSCFFFPTAKAEFPHKCNGKAFCVDKTEFILATLLKSLSASPLTFCTSQALAEQEIGTGKERFFGSYSVASSVIYTRFPLSCCLYTPPGPLFGHFEVSDSVSMPTLLLSSGKQYQIFWNIILRTMANQRPNNWTSGCSN